MPGQTRRDMIIDVIRRKPNLSEAQIADEIFPNPYQQRVNPICRALLKEGLVKRSGRGGPYDPYTYTLPEKPRA